jgi:DNA adenine methylase
MTRTTSILRYPGGKTRFAPFIEEALILNRKRPRLFVEPFCGGASVSLSLLERGAVEAVVLNDADPLLSNLWQVVFSDDVHWLVEQVRTVALDLDEWKRQKSLLPTTPRQAALKALYLNRTSFNGIIHQAGPQGGWKQDKRKVGERFNRERLVARLLELNALRTRVHVLPAQDWRAACEGLIAKPGVVFYFDPPYFHKADQLYGHCFDTEQHLELRDYLAELAPPWLLSYDDAPEVRELYRAGDLLAKPKWSARVLDSTYSAHPVGGASFVGRELFFTNLERLPLPGPAEREHVGISVKPFRHDETAPAARVSARRESTDLKPTDRL